MFLFLWGLKSEKSKLHENEQLQRKDLISLSFNAKFAVLEKFLGIILRFYKEFILPFGIVFPVLLYFPLFWRQGRFPQS